MRAAFVPTVAFRDDSSDSGPDYARAELWISRPGLPGDPSSWLPAGFAAKSDREASIFFVHPTSFLDKSRWNGPLDDRDSQARARLFVRSEASAFNGVGEIWAPKYRQATVGAFFSDKPDAGKAVDLAYRDVLAAFEQFLRQAPRDRPMILAGHSQGSLHLARLLRERIAGTPLAKRVVAAYLIGLPISIGADLPVLGLAACQTSADAGCILAWQSYAEPADPGQVKLVYAASLGANGKQRAESPLLCINPLTGNQSDSAPASANLGTLVPDADFSTAEIRAGAVPARCDKRGLLLIGENPPALPRYVLPGNNYHVFDYTLFWANVRADAARRLANFARR